jgi:pilus assembly protein Flp/PilA
VCKKQPCLKLDIAELGSRVSTIIRFLNEERGNAAIEYALIAAIMAVGIIAGLQSVSKKMSSVFSNVSASL